MERNILEREITVLRKATDSLSPIAQGRFSDAEVIMFFAGEFTGTTKEKSFLRDKDLKTKQQFNGKQLFYDKNEFIDILGENGDWYLVKGRAMYEEKGSKFIYSEKGITVNRQGWIKKSWVGIHQSVRTIGFEFDVHYGFMKEIVTKDGKSVPPDKTKLTTHDNAKDGFNVKLDGPRFEIATKPSTVNDTGLRELDDTIKNIRAFTKELQDGCKTGIPDTIPGFAGTARVFRYSKMASGLAGLPIIKLPVKNKFSANCAVWASPQATVAIPLAKVALLVDTIKKSEGKDSGIALTGGAGSRMGLQSEALYRAKSQVDKYRKAILSKKPRIKLSNGKEVNQAIFSEKLRGFLILLASYLWTSELPYDFADPNPKDYEPFAKAYLPINVKAPFPDIFSKLLNDDEQLFFKEHFAMDKTARLNLFRLVKTGAVEDDGKNKLFPKGPAELGEDSVHRRQRIAFGTVPTWDDLILHTLDPSHKGWGNVLLVTLSKPIGLDNTAPNVALELRRVGFRAMFDYDWKRFTEHIFTLVKEQL